MCLLFGILVTIFLVPLLGKEVPLYEDHENSELLAVLQSDYSVNTHGTPAKPGEFPSVLALEIHKPKESRTCTGTIINEEYILTSGGCVEDAQESSVEFGCLYLDDCNETVNGTGMVHPNFKRIDGVILNDLALVHIQEKKPDMIFATIDLPPLLGQGCIAVGYSNSVEEHNVTRKLFKHELHSILPCHQLTPNLDTNRLHVLCATPKPNENITLQDYGGPLFCDGVQIGVTSQSIKAKTEGGELRGVLIWTPVAKFREWIRTSSSSATSLWFGVAIGFALLFSLSHCV